MGAGLGAVPDVIPGLGAKTDKPRINKSADLGAHSLTPTDAFVLSRVDGATSYEQICHLTGMGAEATIAVLGRLKRELLILGAKDEEPAAPTSLLARLDDGSPVSPEELAGGPDLTPDVKARLVRVRRRLKTLSPEELLGIAPDADRGTIKRAYLAASKELHPDRFYGKDIGPFREALGEVFTGLTRAMQTLQGASSSTKAKK